MPVYMIQAGEAGPVKIGFSVNAQDRLRQMQVGHWHELKLIRCVAAERIDEGIIQRRFRHLHIRNEWFAFHADMIGEIGYRDLPLAPVERRSNPARFDAIVAAFGGLKVIGQITGDRSHAACQWRHAGIPHKVWHLLIAAAEARGIQGITTEALAATRPAFIQQEVA